MPSYWLLVGEDDTWASLLGNGYWAIRRTWKKKARKIRKGDKAVAYVKFFSAIYGTVEIISDSYYDENTSILGEPPGSYPIRFKIKPDIFLKEPTSIRPLIRKLSFIRNKERWYGYFQTSLKEISKEDCELIISHLQKVLHE
jgi:predicted RNA-binding protein